MKRKRTRMLLVAGIFLAALGVTLARNVSMPSAFADSVTLTDVGCEITA